MRLSLIGPDFLTRIRSRREGMVGAKGEKRGEGWDERWMEGVRDQSETLQPKKSSLLWIYI